ncbi:hypothetical protein A6O26_19945 [Acidithiobacillus thiooxidans]|nr:hypothetical protein A6O26_19945 [Acidithiobacillus thiooxidans]
MIALVDLARHYPVALIVPTMRALKAIGPALLFQRFGTFLFRTKPAPAIAANSWLLLSSMHLQPYDLYGIRQLMMRKVQRHDNL